MWCAFINQSITNYIFYKRISLSEYAKEIEERDGENKENEAGN